MLDDVAELLRDGQSFAGPTASLQRAAAHLVSLGVCRTTTSEFVRCAEPRDRDFPPRVRDCIGRVFLDDTLDEAGGECRCDSCGRVVLPVAFAKTRHAELRTEVLPEGVVAFVRLVLAREEAAVEDVSRGVFRVALGPTGVYACILDVCDRERFLARDWARFNPTCYVVVDATQDRLLPEEWLSRLKLAEVVTGKVDLVEEVRRLSSAHEPDRVTAASVPVYTKGVLPIVAQPPASFVPSRRFVVEMGPNALRVEGVDVMGPQADTRFAALRVLWRQYLDDLAAGRCIGDFTTLGLQEIASRMQNDEKSFVDNHEALRRAINRFQEQIATTVKRELGLPIGRDDVIETCAWAGALAGPNGYRINPRTVWARPFPESPQRTD